MTTEAMRSHPDLAELQAKYETGAQTPVARAGEGLTFLAGLYLAISPWVIGFDRFPTLTVNNLIVGIALAVLALGFSSYGRTRGIAWVAPLVGAWTIIAPWVVSGDVATTTTVWSNVVTGVVVVLLGLGAMSLGMNRTR
ncbi:MAG TPA: SPW repeat protein [Pseudonocardiaceae bacterium]|nr:SPW repeat protein [Pseudonocardiaceae bacterium]